MNDPNATVGPRLPPAIVGPIQAFLRTESAGGIVLLVATAAALLWANAPFGASYGDVWGTSVGFNLKAIGIDESLQRWVNDALMAVFFFVVGLEIKRELVQGELAGVRKAALPIAGALGGMLVPAAIFFMLNFGGAGEHGWGIAMATDIAFAVGVLTLAGTSVPPALKVFLLAVAIVDDIGAIIVIAVFYTESIDVVWLAGAVALLALVIVLTNFEVRHMLVYAALAAGVWLCVFESGIHATIAGVALGLLTPAHPFAAAAPDSRPIADRLETALHPWTSFVIVPVFALANAGVAFDGGLLRDAASSRVTLGVALGLVAGKPLGIMLFTWLAVRTRLSDLPEGVRWMHLAGAALLGGIGFTVALFISGLAFSDPQLADQARIAILAASAVMACAGYAWLRAVAAIDRSRQAP